LLSDDFRSGLDKEMEKRVVKLTETEYKGLTVVAVAYGLDTVVELNKVMISERGEIQDYIINYT